MVAHDRADGGIDPEGRRSFWSGQDGAQVRRETIGVNRNEGATMKIYSRVLTTIDYPGAHLTQLTGINEAGAIVGIAEDAQGVAQAFLYKHGSFQAVALPPTGPAGWHCELGGINEAGCIVGTRYDDPGGQRAFLLTPSGPGGTYTWADLAISLPRPPDSSPSKGYGINDAGDVVGSYVGVGACYGFLVHQGGSAVSLAAPFPGTLQTSANALNASGAIVGSSWSSTPGEVGTAEQHGFLFSGGTFTPLDYPGADWTRPTAINSAGDIVGGYCFPEGSWHGFMRRQGRFTPFDLPAALLTDPRGINDAGSIVGTYTDAQNRLHGFLSQRVVVSVPFPREKRLRVPLHVFPPWVESRSEARGV